MLTRASRAVDSMDHVDGDLPHQFGPFRPDSEADFFSNRELWIFDPIEEKIPADASSGDWSRVNIEIGRPDGSRLILRALYGESVDYSNSETRDRYHPSPHT